MAHEQTMCCAPRCDRRAGGFTSLPVCATHGMQFYGEIQSMLKDPPREVAALAARPPKVVARQGFGREVGVVYYARCSSPDTPAENLDIKNLGYIFIHRVTRVSPNALPTRGVPHF